MVGQGKEISMVGLTTSAYTTALLTTKKSNQSITTVFCYETVESIETLVLNANITSFKPLTYQNTITIYPNPTIDQINIDFGSNFATINGYTLKIVNSISQTVYTTAVTQQNTSVKLSTWTGNGTYFVHLIDNNGNTVDVKKRILQ